MDSDVDDRNDKPPVRFNMRTLLVVVTAVCVVGTLLAKTLEPKAQLTVWGFICGYGFLGLFIYRQFRANRQRIERVSNEGIIVRIDPKWLRRIRSPWFYVIAAFTGVSVSFAPACLIWCGDVSNYGTLKWVLAPTCLLMIYFVPGFYMSLAGEVIAQLAKQQNSGSDESTSEHEAAAES